MIVIGAAGLAVVGPGVAAAQTGPPNPPVGPTQPGQTRPTAPTSVPPSGGQQPGAGGSGASVTPSGPVLAALRDVAVEAGALVRLGAASGDGSARLATAVAPVAPEPGTSHERLLAILTKADSDGAAELPTLATAGSLSQDVQLALSPLADTDRANAGAGRSVSVPPEAYLRALDHLLHFGGGPPAQASPPDPAGIASELAALHVTAAPVGRSRRSAAIAGLVAAILVLAGVLVWVARRRPRYAAVPPARPEARPVRIPSPVEGSMEGLLDVSRRLTSAAVTGDIEREIVRDALALVTARGAALVRQDGGSLTVVAQSDPALLVDDAIGEGAIRRVAETGQPLVQVSATEPSIRNLPASLVAVPLVGGGRVGAVLVLVRAESQPFTTAERDVLQAFAPVAAAAMTSAEVTRAAREESLVDALTGVGNRRRFDADLATASTGPTVALFIADIDHFKQVNDVHGHPAGDALLRAVAMVLREGVRPADSVYRFGGEEFCVLLPGATLDEAAEVAERVRQDLAARTFDVGTATPLGVTASFGVAFGGGDGADLLARADAALYEAKHGGRNRVATAA